MHSFCCVSGSCTCVFRYQLVRVKCQVKGARLRVTEKRAEDGGGGFLAAAAAAVAVGAAAGRGRPQETTAASCYQT